MIFRISLTFDYKSDYIELTLTDGKTKTKCYSAEDITKIIAEYNSEHAHGGE